MVMAVVVVAASMSETVRRKPRISMEEREAVLTRLQRDYKDEPVCVPTETSTNNSKSLKTVDEAKITKRHVRIVISNIRGEDYTENE